MKHYPSVESLKNQNQNQKIKLHPGRPAPSPRRRLERGPESHGASDPQHREGRDAGTHPLPHPDPTPDILQHPEGHNQELPGLESHREQRRRLGTFFALVFLVLLLLRFLDDGVPEGGVQRRKSESDGDSYRASGRGVAAPAGCLLVLEEAQEEEGQSGVQGEELSSCGL